MGAADIHPSVLAGHRRPTMEKPVSSRPGRRPIGSNAMPVTPPSAPRRPHALRAHGDERVDPWYWLRERDDPDVVGYLEAENDYAKAALSHTESLQARLFDEIKGRIQQTDVSAPSRKGRWDYFSRTIEGLQYPIHGRRPAGARTGEDETVLLDENVLAEGHGFFSLGGFAVSPNQKLLAYSVDFDGSERHELRFRDLARGADLPDIVPDTYYGLGWAAGGRTVVYTRGGGVGRGVAVWRSGQCGPGEVAGGGGQVGGRAVGSALC